MVNIRAGTLDDTAWLVPVAHIFMKSALSSVEPAADAGCYETPPPDFDTLTLAWRAMSPDYLPGNSFAFPLVPCRQFQRLLTRR